MTGQSPSPWRAVPLWVTGLVLLTLAGNLYAYFALGPLPDEAYYWVWSQRLAAGYFDHPPGVAWLIRPFTAVLGNGAWVLRLPAALAWLAGAWAAADLAMRLNGRREAGMAAVLVWASLPIVQAGFHLVTPDSALVLFGWATYALAWRALTRPEGAWWLAVGLAAGLTVLGKYTGALVPLGIFLALLLSGEGRRRLASPWPWLGALVALAVFSPVLVWNAAHDWVSFAFQLRHGVQEEVAQPLLWAGIFLAGQFAVATPWGWVGMAAFALRPARWPVAAPPPARHLLTVGFWLPLLVFGAAALTGGGGPNWPVTAYLPGTVLLAGPLARWLLPGQRPGAPARPLAVALVTLAVVASVAAVNAVRFPQGLAALGLAPPAERTQLTYAYGWGHVGDTLKALLAEAAEPAEGGRFGPRCTVVGDSYQTASMAAWLLRDAGRVTASPRARVSQYTLWATAAGPGAAPPCLYLAQYKAEGAIPERVSLEPLGEWRRVRLLQLRNPDLTERWYAFYEPAGAQGSP
jgi:4-amino-4-deoxy-L-arabinose transferase-like glycosyltransferase